jgi:hypothetical protein
MFATLQDRLPKELRLAGITSMDAANRFLADDYLPRHNARFARPPEEAGSAFVPFAGTLEDILCVQEERLVGNDNTVRYKNRVLQIPADRHRHHYVKVTVRVHEYPDGTLAASTARGAWRDIRPQAPSSTTPAEGRRDALRRRRACGLVDNAAALPTTPQAPQQQQKRSLHLLPAPVSSNCW